MIGFVLKGGNVAIGHREKMALEPSPVKVCVMVMLLVCVSASLCVVQVCVAAVCLLVQHCGTEHSDAGPGGELCVWECKTLWEQRRSCNDGKGKPLGPSPHCPLTIYPHPLKYYGNVTRNF